MALIANPSGIFSINGYREIVEYTKFWAIGSGDSFALGALENLYDQDLSATQIAEKAALTATKFDPGCALPIQVETIKKSSPAKRKRTTKKKKS
ncbi:MAG: hypothetical protein F6K11_19925 [Leptolyngbya sp. SIO3F4]|nr:hypothetical protein [Leptolyngbya sp. SIO3F4]